MGWANDSMVRVRHGDSDPGRMAAELRQRDVPIIARVSDDSLVFDCRTLSEEDADRIPPALVETLRELDSQQ